MGLSRFLVASLFNTVHIFPSHVVTASSEVVDHEGFRVGSERRDAENSWTPAVDDTAANVTCLCDQPRASDMLIIDQNHNLDGQTVRVQISDDGFLTTAEPFVGVVPSAVTPNSRLSDGIWVRNREGAIACLYTAEPGMEHRLVVDAMGAGLKPQIGGAYLGQSFQPSSKPPLPYAPNATQTTASGPIRRVSGNAPLRYRVERDDYGVAQYHIEELFWTGRPMWIFPDEDQAENFFLATVNPGTRSMPFGGIGPWYDLAIDYVEYSPRHR